jgi:type I restriction enzyme S subunit
MSVEGWKNNSLISLLKILKSGGTPNTSQSNFYGGDIPFVAIEDMSASRKYLCSTVKSLTKEGIKNSNAWLVPQNSLLYSIYATLGLVRINTIPVATNQAILAMIVNDEMVDQDYLYYWLEYIRDSVVNLSAQTTQSNLSATTVKPFVVQHPQNKQEQTQIATILSTIDRAIEQTEALIAKQQRIKTGLMQDLLTKGIDENGNIRSEETHEFKDSPLGRIPVEWEVKSLDELTTKIGDGIHTTPAYSENTGFFFINGNNLGDGSIHITSDTLCVNQGEFRKYYIELDDRTILYSINGTIGNIAFYKNEPVVLGKSAAYIKCKKSVNARLIYHILQSEPVHRFYDYELTGSTIKNLSLAAMRATPIKIPRMQEEQEFLACRLDLCVYEIGQANNCLSKLRSLKSGIMQDLLTGIVRVTELIKERETDNL